MYKYYSEIDYNQFVLINDHDKVKKYNIPNSYFINSWGILYNSFGINYHSNSYLNYTLNYIKQLILEESNKYLSNHYIIDSNDYNNRIMWYKKIYNDIVNLDIVDIKYIKMFLNININYSNQFISLLIKGIVSTNIILLETFKSIANDSNKQIIYKQIINNTNGDLVDILIKYCNFHKIESQAKKTITTASLDFELFKNYLDEGYILNVVSKSLDDLDIHAIIARDRFLEKEPIYDQQIYLARK